MNPKSVTNTPQFRAGYACINLDTDSAFRTLRLSSLTLEKWKEIIKANLITLREIVKYNRSYRLPMYRVSSDLIPFGSADVMAFDWGAFFAAEFCELRELISGAMRISVHPGQYTELNSLDPSIVGKSVRDLEYHVQVLQLLGATSQNKMVLHIGGVYGDKQAAIRRFTAQANQLSPQIRTHLVLENDERLFNIEEVMEIGKATGLPVIFDNLHHEINPPQENTLSYADWIDRAGATWKENDGRQIIHYSQQAPGKRAGAHSETLRTVDFLSYVKEIKVPLDIMLEVKDKNRSAEKIQMVLTGDMRLAETIWAKSKYSVLARSQAIYQEVRKTLKDKQQPDLIHFAGLLEKAQEMPYSSGEAANAAEHVWGYFKNAATEKERASFQLLLKALPEGVEAERRARLYLSRMLRKYPDPYLSESYYLK